MDAQALGSGKHPFDLNLFKGSVRISPLFLAPQGGTNDILEMMCDKI